MDTFPKIFKNNISFRIEFCSIIKNTDEKLIEMVLDFDQFGEIVGVEIINLLFHVGKNGLGIISHVIPNKGIGLRYSYDEENDSFFLKLRPGRSHDQIEVEGAALLDENGQILCLNVVLQ